MIFTLDPAVGTSNAAGVAIFNPEIRRLVETGIIRPAKDVDAGVSRIVDVAWQAANWFRQHTPKGTRSVTLVAEWPFIYPNERNKNPNTALVPLAAVISATVGYLSTIDSLMVVHSRMYLPREWKGTIPGDVFCERIVERLDPRERALLQAVMPAGLRHNATDAVGIGLHYLGRMGRTRAVHNEAQNAP